MTVQATIRVDSGTVPQQVKGATAVEKGRHCATQDMVSSLQKEIKELKETIAKRDDQLAAKDAEIEQVKKQLDKA